MSRYATLQCVHRLYECQPRISTSLTRPSLTDRKKATSRGRTWSLLAERGCPRPHRSPAHPDRPPQHQRGPTPSQRVSTERSVRLTSRQVIRVFITETGAEDTNWCFNLESSEGTKIRTRWFISWCLIHLQENWSQYLLWLHADTAEIIPFWLWL